MDIQLKHVVAKISSSNEASLRSRCNGLDDRLEDPVHDRAQDLNVGVT
jgi:hypothetical protein